jgi:hypothetical protein
MKFLAVLAPYRASEAPPEIGMARRGSKMVFTVDGSTISADWGPGAGNLDIGGR